MKRLRLLTSMVFGILLIPLTALAQTGETPAAGDDSGLTFSAVVLVAAGIKMIVDWVKTAVPALSGIVINLVATALGYGATYIEQVGSFGDWVTRLNTALVLAGTSALVHEGAAMFRARRELAEAGSPKASSPFDEGYNPGDLGYGTDRTDMISG